MKNKQTNKAEIRQSLEIFQLQLVDYQLKSLWFYFSLPNKNIPMLKNNVDAYLKLR